MEKLKNLFMKNDEGQVGIGTLIIFIAMVLVAAVAAAVLIQTSGNLQQRAQSTGQEATDEVSSNLDIEEIEGIRANSTSDPDSNYSDRIEYLKLRAGLNAGSTSMDLSQLVITISDANHRNVLRYNSSEEANGTDILEDSTSQFSMDSVRDEDDSFSKANPVMNRGDLVTINVSTLSDGTNNSSYYDSINGMDIPDDNSTSSKLDLETRTTVSLSLTPEAGSSNDISFMTPPSYGVDKRISLYP
ncbi:MAG: archaellin/type IV pilin N-terminal domain-containing protein [Methanohalobium sp.]|uniref:archaellin/type IV pilin N-terminal domain-containing protein n=1 Tax=Methanohalobium sp. TaxID=2837493 RepID=UPI00397CE0C3